MSISWWLLDIASTAGSATDRVAERIEAIRTGLGAGAGVGAAVGLMLAFRRQRYQEIATLLDSFDASERRITELYTSAAGQLGSDKSPVRLAGLYALERLAQDNPGHRQTIANVICAYLRMPYAPEPTAAVQLDPDAYASRNVRRQLLERRSRIQLQATATDGVDERRLEEREVRMAAQTILAEHLRPVRTSGEESASYWPGLRLDLRRATLINCAFGRCHLRDVDFRGAIFVGDTYFWHAELVSVNFAYATFRGDAFFSKSSLDGTFFADAKFRGEAKFESAVFSGAWVPGHGIFANVTFDGETTFDGAKVSPLLGERPWSARVKDNTLSYSWPSAWRVDADPDGDGAMVVGCESAAQPR